MLELNRMKTKANSVQVSAPPGGGGEPEPEPLKQHSPGEESPA